MPACLGASNTLLPQEEQSCWAEKGHLKGCPCQILQKILLRSCRHSAKLVSDQILYKKIPGAQKCLGFYVYK